jgi:hypothetical protein
MTGSRAPAMSSRLKITTIRTSLLMPRITEDRRLSYPKKRAP